MNPDLEQLKNEALAATPGDWHTANTEFNAVSVGGEAPFYDGEQIVARVQKKRDKWFIAAANPTVVLELIERLERAEQRAARAEQSNGHDDANRLGTAIERIMEVAGVEANGTARSLNYLLDGAEAVRLMLARYALRSQVLNNQGKA